jgi:hypothetical protein
MLMPEKDLFYINEKTKRRVYCNRFNIWDKLAQHYYVEQLSRMIDGRLEYQRYLNNTHLKGIPKKTNNNFDSDSSESEDEYDEEDLNNKKTILVILIRQRPQQKQNINHVSFYQKKMKHWHATWHYVHQ